MIFVIMADGKESRWHNYLGVSKHFAQINGEPLIHRTVRLLHSLAPLDSQFIVTSHDENYQFQFCTRYEPLNNVLEIDRFTEELIDDDVCFLYGDTFYTSSSIKSIIETNSDHTLFFGNPKSIVAIKIVNGLEFKFHKHRVRELFLQGRISQCKGWQVYQSFTDQDLLLPPQIKDYFVTLDEHTVDINSSDDYIRLVGEINEVF